MNFLKIEINNFEAICTRPGDIITIRKVKESEHQPLPESYKVVIGLTTGEKVTLVNDYSSDAADKFIDDLIQEISDNEDNNPIRFGLPEYSPGYGIDLPCDPIKEWQVC